MTSREPSEAELAALLSALDDDDGGTGEAPALQRARAHIAADLQRRQGGFRESSRLARAWPVALASLLGLGFVFALSPAPVSWPLALSLAGACLASALALLGTLLAPARPALGERLALLALGGGLFALCLQGLELGRLAPPGQIAASLPGTARCGSVLLAGAAAPLVLLVFALRRSGLPVRALHAAGLSVAAFALAGVGVFRHCVPGDGWHVALGHVALPLLGSAAVGLFAYRWLTRRRGGA